jgi:hypothetical protein
MNTENLASCKHKRHAENFKRSEFDFVRSSNEERYRAIDTQ